MSEQSISIVPKQSAYPNKSAKTKEILDWLVLVDIVKSQLSDCILGDNEGYAISFGARTVSTEPDLHPFGYTVNSLEVITVR